MCDNSSTTHTKYIWSKLKKPKSNHTEKHKFEVTQKLSLTTVTKPKKKEYCGKNKKTKHNESLSDLYYYGLPNKQNFFNSSNKCCNEMEEIEDMIFRIKSLRERLKQFDSGCSITTDDYEALNRLLQEGDGCHFEREPVDFFSLLNRGMFKKQPATCSTGTQKSFKSKKCNERKNYLRNNIYCEEKFDIPYTTSNISVCKKLRPKKSHCSLKQDKKNTCTCNSSNVNYKKHKIFLSSLLELKDLAGKMHSKLSDILDNYDNVSSEDPTPCETIHQNSLASNLFVSGNESRKEFYDALQQIDKKIDQLAAHVQSFEDKYKKTTKSSSFCGSHENCKGSKTKLKNEKLKKSASSCGLQSSSQSSTKLACGDKKNKCVGVSSKDHKCKIRTKTPEPNCKAFPRPPKKWVTTSTSSSNLESVTIVHEPICGCSAGKRKKKCKNCKKVKKKLEVDSDDDVIKVLEVTSCESQNVPVSTKQKPKKKKRRGNICGSCFKFRK